jgi:hypothetical protein
LGDCGIGLPCGAVGICPVGIGRAPGIDPPIPPKVIIPLGLALFCIWATCCICWAETPAGIPVGIEAAPGLPCAVLRMPIMPPDCPVVLGGMYALADRPGIDIPLPPPGGAMKPPVLVGIGLPGSAPGMFSIVPMRCGIGLPGTETGFMPGIVPHVDPLIVRTPVSVAAH